MSDYWPPDVPDDEHVARIMAEFGLEEPDAWIFLSTSRGGDGDIVGHAGRVYFPTDVPDEVHLAALMAEFNVDEGHARAILRTSRGGPGDVVLDPDLGIQFGVERFTEPYDDVIIDGKLLEPSDLDEGIAEIEAWLGSETPPSPTDER